MSDLILPNFPPSLLARLDRYIELLEELNPGHKWTRGDAMASLLARALAEIEGAQVRNRRLAERRVEPQTAERSERPDERRSGVDRRHPHSGSAELAIESLLRDSGGAR